MSQCHKKEEASIVEFSSLAIIGEKMQFASVHYNILNLILNKILLGRILLVYR